jgi:hypothetical protein
MKERRTLTEGLNAGEVTLSEREREFILGKTAESQPAAKTEVQTAIAANAEPKANNKILPQISSRVLITTRATPEVASALKRASLQRQLDGIEPFYVQEILDEAIGEWLRKNGYQT